MIEELLPFGVATAERRGDWPTTLFPEEEALIRRAVEVRRREFATGRLCAREALARLGEGPGPLLRAAHGEPAWPDGVVGSITHCAGYRAAACARTTSFASLGIDAEPNEPLPDGALNAIAVDTEVGAIRRLLRSSERVRWDRLLFCTKEAVYKAWFPLSHEKLVFEDAVITVEATGTFDARLLRPGPTVDGQRLGRLSGRWSAHGGVVAAAVAVPRRPAPKASGASRNR